MHDLHAVVELFVAFGALPSAAQLNSAATTAVMRAGHIRHVSAAICARHHGEYPTATEN
jgi:hypothetical protein